MSASAGKDPLSGKQLWHRKTLRTEQAAQIAQGKLLEQAEAGRRPDTRVCSARQLAGAWKSLSLTCPARWT